ncbi:MAG: sterol desaturase family protein [Pseudomonadales bacterium]|nr:sterol desaturase family protein [Pseudomonadales bacterium]
MIEIMLSYEPAIRLATFLSVFAIVANLEVWAPRKKQRFSLQTRWPSNFGIALLNTLLVRIIAPMGIVGIAMLGSQYKWGLLHYIELNTGITILISILSMDLVIYFQHRFFHVIPVFWKFHRMHHSDQDFDTTTALRFHPVEILLSNVIKLIVVLSLGPPAIAVLVFEILLNATAMFNHGNIHIPTKLDRMIRFLLVTPDMHRVHHSVSPSEMNSNYGFNLPWWDHMFKTYCAQPKSGHVNMEIGLQQFRDPQELGLFSMLTQPFRKPDPRANDKNP